MKSTIQYLILTIAIISTTSVSSQIYYKPNEKAQEIYNSIKWGLTTERLQGESKKEIEKQQKDLLKCLKLDSNFAQPYAALGNIKMLNQEYLTEKGAFYYYSKYLDKAKKYSFKEFNGSVVRLVDNDNSTSYSFSSTLRNYTLNFKSNKTKSRINNSLFFKTTLKDYDNGEWIEATKDNRIKCLILGYKMNPEYFNTKKGVNSVVTIEELSNYLELCLTDLESLFENHNYRDKSEVYNDYFNLFTIKGELEFNSGKYPESAMTYKLLIGKLKIGLYEDEQRKTIIILKRQVYEKLYNMFMSIGDNESALNSLIEFFKIPFKDTDFNSISFQKKRKEMFRLFNKLNGLSSDQYQICQLDGKVVFCDNKNIELSNYSSAVQFLRIYNNDNLLQIIFGKDGELSNNTINNVYSFYLNKGKDEGMIWPKYKPMNYDASVVSERPTLLFNLYNCECVTNLIDFKGDYYNGFQIYTKSLRDSSLTVIMNVSQDWEMLNKMPITYYNMQKQVVTKTAQGAQLPVSRNCEKLYAIEKQNYENQQALLRAQQLQQEAEVRRLQQEQYYKETQLRLLEQENTKKQKEIDLVNARSQQIEKKQELESQKSANAFMKWMFETPVSRPSSSSASSNSNQNQPQSNGPKWECKGCGNISYQTEKPWSGANGVCPKGGSVHGHDWIPVH
jgi:hypothetical protein